MIRKILFSLSKKSCKIDQENILNLLEFNPSARLLDLGAGDGAWTKIIAAKIGTKNITAVDILPIRPISPIRQIVLSNLNLKFPFPNNYFDVISGNQIIEHIENTDNFLSEIKRVLKPTGYAVISTENLSSWHNIAALLLGWQPFSTTTLSQKGPIGNPLARLTVPIPPKHSHVKAFTYFGLKNLFEKHGFVVESYKSAGYFKLQSLIDPLHCHRITIKVRK